MWYSTLKKKCNNTIQSSSCTAGQMYSTGKSSQQQGFGILGSLTANSRMLVPPVACQSLKQPENMMLITSTMGMLSQWSKPRLFFSFFQNWLFLRTQNWLFLRTLLVLSYHWNERDRGAHIFNWTEPKWLTVTVSGSSNDCNVSHQDFTDGLGCQG